MLVIAKRDGDLRKYLQQNHNQLTWKDRIRIADEIILALYHIHSENAIHRDLHSGNILYSQLNDSWDISDLGFCGPANKSSTSIYGNLPYIAPEIIVGRECTFASDIYSIAILMWEISSGQPPFINYEHDYDLAMNIINGIRPKIVPGTPLEYKNLMVQCWDADPLKRPDIYTFEKKMERITLDYQNMSDKSFQSEIDSSSKELSKVFKKLQINSNTINQAKSHLTISNKRAEIVQCYGLTQNPTNGNYMLVMMEMDIDLRKYLQQNHNQLTWKERIGIAYEIILALYRIHGENANHRDLHSGNILYSQFNDRWFISDLGFCGPADKSSKSIYGNLPYIAPEVIAGRECTFASDIYSIAMLMWEISSGQPPFINYEHDYDLAMNIINGIRPKIVPGTPLEYKNLMIQCWDADPLKRLDVYALEDKMERITLDYQNMSDKSFQSEIDNLEMNKVAVKDYLKYLKSCK
ncbi:kinase-like domain-containing protein [Rhizophagus irregularis DAOM 181602=DAOM 197198]|uniref:Kinase-like domain-containing protein n=1 Tax=Rhizophagus irregularis (strain DAOM 181602 / DAOM 197198 / MUCL 43194) TaxID=747089 RepID=A0A2P4P5R3_RHIID|nr:kinase-like domain-containing protein [Rhizophagus irregularis DAOM 181602=DAOM 197198]POG60725.1 kinase-like domain-containing protein [Rhizophagus irregularis DAOM 181602=DAOM 197198]|eukprot:XP_025167591.1 kinase-like domain-containing protein [Rhizophagus irregularis DAOM 181602=DAOM 197198]